MSTSKFEGTARSIIQQYCFITSCFLSSATSMHEETLIENSTELSFGKDLRSFGIELPSVCHDVLVFNVKVNAFSCALIPSRFRLQSQYILRSSRYQMKSVEMPCYFTSSQELWFFRVLFSQCFFCK